MGEENNNKTFSVLEITESPEHYMQKAESTNKKRTNNDIVSGISYAIVAASLMLLALNQNAVTQYIGSGVMLLSLTINMCANASAKELSDKYSELITMAGLAKLKEEIKSTRRH